MSPERWVVGKCGSWGSTNANMKREILIGQNGREQTNAPTSIDVLGCGHYHISKDTQRCDCGVNLKPSKFKEISLFL